MQNICCLPFLFRKTMFWAPTKTSPPTLPASLAPRPPNRRSNTPPPPESNPKHNRHKKTRAHTEGFAVRSQRPRSADRSFKTRRTTRSRLRVRESRTKESRPDAKIVRKRGYNGSFSHCSPRAPVRLPQSRWRAGLLLTARTPIILYVIRC